VFMFQYVAHIETPNSTYRDNLHKENLKKKKQISNGSRLKLRQSDIMKLTNSMA
jgi:hypothetical protein